MGGSEGPQMTLEMVCQRWSACKRGCRTMSVLWVWLVPLLGGWGDISHASGEPLLLICL